MEYERTRQMDPANLKFVQLEKVRDTDANVPAYGQSLPIGHTMVGWLLAEPRVDERLLLLRVVRNGAQALGIFRSSPVVEIDEGIIRTLNSVYRRFELQPTVAQTAQVKSLRFTGPLGQACIV